MLGGEVMTKKFFVYGSLMEGLFNYEIYLKGKILTKKYARTRGKLFHLSEQGYPAMVEGKDWVYGELIEISDYENTVESVDAMENFLGKGNPENEYNRNTIEVELLDDGSLEKAYAYIYNRKDAQTLVRDEIYIKHGDWRKFLEEYSLKKAASV